MESLKIEENKEENSKKSLLGCKGSKSNRNSKRPLLKVRSSSSRFGLINQSSSKALYDPMESFDFFYKMIVIGDESVGKTNFMLRIAKGRFEKKPKTTYGVEFEFKTVPLPGSN